MIEELINLKNETLDIDNFRDEELDYILNYICTSQLADFGLHTFSLLSEVFSGISPVLQKIFGAIRDNVYKPYVGV